MNPKVPQMCDPKKNTIDIRPQVSSSAHNIAEIYRAKRIEAAFQAMNDRPVSDVDQLRLLTEFVTIADSLVVAVLNANT